MPHFIWVFTVFKRIRLGVFIPDNAVKAICRLDWQNIHFQSILCHHAKRSRQHDDVLVGKIIKGLFMVWEFHMGVCPRLEFDNIMFINCLGMTFIFMVHLSFYAIPLLIYDVIYDITTIP